MMNGRDKTQLGKTLWGIADDLRGAMNADDFRDYMLSFLFLRYLSDNYEAAAQKELGRDYPQVEGDGRRVPLAIWYANNPDDVADFERQMRRKVHYVIKPDHLWASIANLARTQNGELLNTLQAAFKYIETESFQSTFQGLFSEINLASDKLGKKYDERNAKLCTIIQKIAEGLTQVSTDADTLGDAYEYLIGQFAAGSGKKAASFIRRSRFQIFCPPSSHWTARSRKRERKPSSKVFWTLPVVPARCSSTCASAWGRTASAKSMDRKATSPLITWRA